MSSRRIAAVAAIMSLLLLLPLILLPRMAHGQELPGTVREQGRNERLDGKLRVPDSTHAQVLELRDGSTLLGRVTAVGTDSVRFQTSYAEVTIARTMINDVRLVRRPSVSPSGDLWPADPNATRLFFAPTGRMLDRGDGYFSDTYLFFLSFFTGVSSRVTLGAGMSVFPSDDFMGDNLFYVMPKVGVIQTSEFNVAIGGLAGMAPGFDDASFGIGYAVATAGGPDGSVTGGLGVGYLDGEFADRPMFMLGANKRLSRRTAFVTENYMIPSESGALVSYGLRIFGEKLAFDLAFWNVVGSDDSIPFPGIPYVAFSSHY